MVSRRREARKHETEYSAAGRTERAIAWRGECRRLIEGAVISREMKHEPRNGKCRLNILVYHLSFFQDMTFENLNYVESSARSRATETECLLSQLNQRGQRR